MTTLPPEAREEHPVRVSEDEDAEVREALNRGWTYQPSRLDRPASEPRPAVWGGRIARALSIRVIFLSFVVGVCAGVLVQLVWKSAPLMAVVWIVAGLCYLGAVFNDGQMIRCPHCQRRVKMGADTCQHCGYSGA